MSKISVSNEDIKESVETLVREADSNPSNTELLFAVRERQKTFREHSDEDHKFQDDTRKTDQTIITSLDSLHEKLAHLGERLDSIEDKMKPILELYEGLTFGSKAVKWTSGIVLAITVIVGSGIAIVKYLKG